MLRTSLLAAAIALGCSAAAPPSAREPPSGAVAAAAMSAPPPAAAPATEPVAPGPVPAPASAQGWAPAPWEQIPVVDLDNRPATLAAVIGGRPALVNLWAPWCHQCMTELPDLDRLARQLAGCGVVIGVAVGEEPAHAAAFVRQYGLAFPQLVDQGYRVADALKQSRIPATFVLDRRGAIVHAGLALDQAALDALRTTVRGLDCYLTALPGA